MTKTEQLKPQLTAQDLASAMKGSGKKQSADILNDLTGKANINMITYVNNPMIYNVMNVKSKSFGRRGYSRSALLFDSIGAFQKEICTSGTKENRAKLILKAVESVLRQDFEKDRIASKMVGAQR